MASSQRAVHQLSRAAIPKAPHPRSAEARSYHRLLKEHSPPRSLMQGFNKTSSPAHLHTSRPLPGPAIDFIRFPQPALDLSYTEIAPEILRIPRLPTNSLPPREGTQIAAIEEVIKPEIHTVSADSTHIASPSAMSEVTDNHAMDLDVYDLTGKVAQAAKRVKESGEREVGIVRGLWEGMLDDLMGAKKGSKA